MGTRAWQRAGGRVAEAVALAALVAAGCEKPDSGRANAGRGGVLLAADSAPPEFSSAVADFSLTERSGRTVGLADLRGRPWVANFFFSTCTGPCPRLIANMRRLQEELAGRDVRLVSITVDPATDTRERLTEYAADLGADPERWWFLTGDEAHIYELIQGSFRVAVQRALPGSAPPGAQVTHTTRFFVVDVQGNVRGAFDGQTDEGVAQTAALARSLGRSPERPR